MNIMVREGTNAIPGGTALLEGLPFGVAVYDPRQRLAFINQAYHDITGVPFGTLLVGSELADNLRLLAHHGLFGPGDREAQVAELLRLDLSKPHHMRRRRPDGRSFESNYVPLENGSHMVCVTDTTHHVTQREQAEKDSAQAFLAVSNLRNGLAVFGADRCLVLHNRRFPELMGLPALSLSPGLPFWEMMQLLHRQENYATYDGEIFLAGQISLDRARPSQVRRVRDTGQVLDICSDPLPDGGWTITVVDVTALARAEDEGRRRAEQLDGILRRIPHGVCVWGPDRRVAMFNRSYAELMRGAPLAVGDELEDVIRRRAEAGEWGQGDVETIIAQQMGFDLSRPQMRRRRRPNGITIDIRTTPLVDGGHISVLTDVTSLVEAEFEAAQRASEMDAMLASTRHGIVLWGPDRRVVAFNHVAETVQELRPGLLVVGRKLDDLVAEVKATGAYGSDQDADAYISKLNARDPRKQHRRQRITPSGRVLDILSDPTPDGGWVATYTDISDVRLLEDELRHAKNAASAADMAKARFLSTMSHELRTPLNSVIGFSEALIHSAQDATANLRDVMEYGQSINESGRQLLGTIDTILDVARLEAGHFEMSSDRVDLQYLIRTCVNQAGQAASSAGVAIKTELPCDLPLMRGDERRLRQVLSQLLSNAIKFTERLGSVAVYAQWAPVPRGADPGMERDLLVCVADSGIGIPEPDLERVFEPFTQVDGTLSRRVEGAGLGLYIGRALMRAHGGDLDLHSRVGEGTTAVLRLPAFRLVVPAIALPPVPTPIGLA